MVGAVRMPMSGLVQDVEVEDIAGALTVSEWDFSASKLRLGGHGFVLASGRGALLLAGSSHAVEGPCVIWLPSGSVARVRLDAGARGAMMAVSDAALGRVVPASSIAGPLRQAIDRPLLGVRIEPAAARATVRDLEEMRRETMQDLPGTREAIIIRLCLVLIAFWRLGGDAVVRPQSSPRHLVQSFLQLVELNARAQWRVEDYARTMGVTTDRLTTAIRRATGQSPLQLVHHRLLDDAENLLQRSPLQVREIADALGFRDAGYFNRFFARQRGISPGRYRQQMLRQQAGADGSYAAWP
ncbi:AraC family transcriptional regulator [Devosia sp. A369]